MKNIKGGFTKLIVATFLASSIAPSLAIAGENVSYDQAVDSGFIENYEQCSCRTLPATKNSAGTINSFGGYVEYSVGDATKVATNNALLSVGSRIATAPGASASVTVGASCHYNLTENMTLSVGQSSTSAELCVSVSTIQTTPPVEEVAVVTPTAGGSKLGVLLIVAAAGAAAFAFDGGNSGPASK